jgi:hypothetical protein
MLAKLKTFSLLGIEALPVEVEVDVSPGALPKRTSSWDCWDEATVTVARRAGSCYDCGIDRGRRWIR